jgi:putative ABC transport system ATP-binding protein
MQIKLQNILPLPLKELPQHHSQIWQTTCDFDIGKNIQISAPSGKGKSTLIHLLYGLRNDYEGEIFFNQQNIQSFSLVQWAEIRQSKISIVFQDLRLFLHLTAEENLLAKALLTPQGKKINIQQLAKKLNIEHLLNKKVGLLSYGERQRVALIRAVLQPFELLLLDEPFSHLDEANIKNASEMLQEYATENKASVLMTSLGYEYIWKFDTHLTL